MLTEVTPKVWAGECNVRNETKPKQDTLSCLYSWVNTKTAMKI